MSGFVECPACAQKPGSPTLCAPCLANRARITELEKALGWVAASTVGHSDRCECDDCIYRRKHPQLAPRNEKASTLQSQLRQLMERAIRVESDLQEVLDKLVSPTTSGYLHSEEQWSLHGINIEDDTLEAVLTPPEHSYEWRCATVERLTTLQLQLGCTHIHARGSDDTIQYVVQWEAV